MSIQSSKLTFEINILFLIINRGKMDLLQSF